MTFCQLKMRGLVPSFFIPFSFYVKMGKRKKIHMKLSREDFLELYNDLPKELQDAMESDKTVSTTERLIDQQDLNNDQAEALVDLIGDSLMGLLPPSEFESALKKRGIPEEKAKKIKEAVSRFVFYPVKETLSNLYEEEMEGDEKEEKKGPKKKISKDRYREPIEK